MGIRHHHDLEVWQLGMDLHRAIDVVVRHPRVATDRKFCDQIRAASAAIPANIAEGFGRYGTRDLLRFLGVARGSLAETQTWLLIGRDRGHLSPEECERLMLLSNRTAGALAALMRSLRARLQST